MSLKDWARNGWLVPHEPSRDEVRNLLALADRDLVDCQVREVSSDWRFAIAYNAVLQAATAALAATGYRAGREAHHYRVLQSLAFTVGADSKLLRTLDQFRKKRNLGGYEQAGVVSEVELGELMQTAYEIRQRVQEWLAQDHPSLVP